MDEFGAHHVDAWLLWLKQLPTASSYRRKSFEHELDLRSVVLNWYRNELNAAFAVPIVKRHRKKSAHKAVIPRRPDYSMRIEDIAAWLAALKSQTTPVYYDLALFMMLTGARLGEATAMQWDCIDLNERIAWVRRTVAWDHHTRDPYIQDEAKNTESIRALKLAPQLVEHLWNVRGRSVGALAFGTPTGGPLRDNAIREAFNRASKTAELPWTGTRITRHTWATLALVANNSNIGAVQANMGHGHRTTTELYAKPAAALTSETVDKAALLILQGHHVRNHATIDCESEILN